MEDVIDQGTPEVDVELEGGDQGTPEAPKVEEPFLRVNDRTVYKTREEALKGYEESGKRISALSKWEKAGREGGLEDPQSLPQLLNELRELRAAKAAAAQTAPKGTETKLTPEQDKARSWLKAELAELGVGSPKELQEKIATLEKQISDFNSRSEQSESLANRRQEEAEQENISRYLSEAKIADPSGKKALYVGTLVGQWIAEDEDRQAEWSKGGVTARNLVKRGTDAILADLEWKGATPKADPSGAARAADKAKAVAANKNLPPQGTAAKKGSEEQPKGRQRRVDPMQKLHEKAYAAFEDVIKSSK